MHASQIRIDELRLRVPGLTREQAYLLGQEVAQRLAVELSASTRTQQLGVLNLRVNLEPGTPRERLGELIAQAVTRSLR
jgi:hypothetical protein